MIGEIIGEEPEDEGCLDNTVIYSPDDKAERLPLTGIGKPAGRDDLNALLDPDVLTKSLPVY
jgi:hypothetical protein